MYYARYTNLSFLCFVSSNQILYTMFAQKNANRPVRVLSNADKVAAIERVRMNESKASVARAISVPESTLRGWCKNEEKLRYLLSQELGENSSIGICLKRRSQKMPGLPEKRSRLESTLGMYSSSASHNLMAAGMGKQSSTNNQTGNETYPSSASKVAWPLNQANSGFDISQSHGLTVKNLAELQQNQYFASDMDRKTSPPVAPSVNESLLHWVRSQQANAGFNSFYASNPTQYAAANPHRLSPNELNQKLLQLQQLQCQFQNANTAKTNAQTPPKTSRHGVASANTNKITGWTNKHNGTYGSFFQNTLQNVANNIPTNNSYIPHTFITTPKPATIENILYSQLTKQSRSTPSPKCHQNPIAMNSPNVPNHNIAEQNDEPENLSTRSPNTPVRPASTSSSGHSITPTLAQHQIKVESSNTSPLSNPFSNSPPPKSDTPDIKPICLTTSSKKSAKSTHAGYIVDNILMHSQQNMNKSINKADSLSVNNGDSDSVNSDHSSSIRGGVEIAEKLNLWLDSCSVPQVTAMQVMQFRSLLNCIRAADQASQQQTASANGQ